MNVWFVVALAVALENPPEVYVDDIIIDGVRGDAMFDGPTSVLLWGTSYWMPRCLRGVLGTLCGPVACWWIVGAFRVNGGQQDCGRSYCV